MKEYAFRDLHLLYHYEMMWDVLIWRSLNYKYVWETSLFSQAGFTLFTFKDLFMAQLLSKQSTLLTTEHIISSNLGTHL